MADVVDLENSDVQNFNILTGKLNNLFFGRTEADREVLEKILDDLNSINYRYTVLTSPTKAALLVNQSCSLVSVEDDILVKKCSQLIKNLLCSQNVCIEGRTLTISVHWCFNALRINDKSIVIDILQALDSLIRNNPNNFNLLTEVSEEIERLVNKHVDRYAPEVTIYCLQCLEACTTFSNEIKKNKNKNFLILEKCADIFICFLNNKVNNVDEISKCRIFKISLIGLQNIITQHPDYLKHQLGDILGLIKAFMLYGVKGVEFIPAQKLTPSALSLPEVHTVREAKGGKLTKQRKHRPSAAHKKELNTIEDISVCNKSGYTPATSLLEYNSDSGTNGNILDTGLRTSDSDFSDNEGNKPTKSKQIQAKVRQASLSLFYGIIKLTEKPLMFSYWTSFIPESTMSGEHNLVACILKDPSSRCRMAALNVLLLLLTTSKVYLLQATLSDRSSSFTPFSVVLGLMIRELHKGLSQALKEMSASVLIQVLKCYAALVQATPYHRLPPGLITEVVRNVKPFIYYRDASVQVTALIVLGCVGAFEPVIPEIKEVMLRFCNVSIKKLEVCSSNQENSENFEFAEFSDSDNEENTENVTIPWLLKRCLNNLGVRFDEQVQRNKEDIQITAVTVAPVKLESLQILSAISRNYFGCLMAPYLPYITKAIEMSLSDKYTDLKLHAGRAIDFIGQAINMYVSNDDVKDTIYVKNCLSFWQTLLSKPLIDLLQNEQHSMLRSVGCDCLSSIGPKLFEQLPRDKQIICVTLLFTCTRDNDSNVRGAAVRALAVCVLYPILRQDTGFVLDTAEAISRTFEDESLLVKTKASWSLGNLSDALALNSKSDMNDEEELPESLLLKLLKISVRGASDSDKIKMNAVRAIGNLMQLVTEEHIQKAEFLQVIENAFNILTKNSTTGSNMKVRWNACYALRNAMKNPHFYGNKKEFNQFPVNWQELVFNALMELVVGFTNLKVRINAALALSSPQLREQYQHFFIPIWVALLKALENIQSIDDIGEYKHRDNLMDQVCLSLGHLTTLLIKEDLFALNDIIQPYLDIFKVHTGKVWKRLLPEKSTVLSDASYTLKQLCDQELISEERCIVQNLLSIFVPEF